MPDDANRESILFRNMRPGEEHRVLELVKAGFDEFVLPDVTPEGEKEFFRAAREMIFDRPGGHFILVAELKKQLIGMIDIRDNSHICLFFVSKEFQRRGIGRGLLEQAMAASAANNPDIPAIGVNSSIFAAECYEKLGFIQSKPEQIVNGIRFVPMLKPVRDGKGVQQTVRCSGLTHRRL